MKYKRILLKFSGEALAGVGGYGIDGEKLKALSLEIKKAHDTGIEIGIVVGGGNIHRGVAGATSGMDRSTSDYMGMIATMINCMALQDSLERSGVQTRLMSSIDMRQVAEPYIRRRAVRHLQKKRIVIFGAGNGNPYFTTDTTAALRGNEINANIIMKATKVDGIFDSDPEKNPNAKKIDHITYMDILNKGLKVMDSTAITLCMDNNLNILVFDMFAPDNIQKAIRGEEIGTLVSKG